MIQKKIQRNAFVNPVRQKMNAWKMTVFYIAQEIRPNVMWSKKDVFAARARFLLSIN
jgi:hypothetical protein